MKPPLFLEGIYLPESSELRDSNPTKIPHRTGLLDLSTFTQSRFSLFQIRLYQIQRDETCLALFPVNICRIKQMLRSPELNKTKTKT